MLPRLTTIVALTAALLLASATDAPAPTTKDHREIIADTSEGGSTNSAQLDLEVDIEFQSDGTTENLLRDRVKTRPVERSRTRLLINNAAGALAAELSLDLKGRAARRARGLTTVKTIRDSSFDPPLSEGRASRVRRPDVRFRRRWEELILEGDRTVLKHKAFFDVRLRGRNGHTVTQLVRVANDAQVVLDYTIAYAATPVATGTVSLGAVSAASGGYTCGPIIIEDDDD